MVERLIRNQLTRVRLSLEAPIFWRGGITIFDLSQFNLKTDLYDLTNFELYYKYGGSTFYYTKFRCIDNPKLLVEVSFKCKNFVIDYNSFIITYSEIVKDNRRYIHRLNKPAVMQYENGKPNYQSYYSYGNYSNPEGPAVIKLYDDDKYFIDGIEIESETFSSLRNNCLKDEIDFTINYTNKIILVLEKMATYYKAKSILDSIDQIKVMLQLINKLS